MLLNFNVNKMEINMSENGEGVFYLKLNVFKMLF